MTVPQARALELAKAKGGLLGRVLTREDLTRLALEYWPHWLVSVAYKANTGAMSRVFRTAGREGVVKVILGDLTGEIGVLDAELALGLESIDGSLIVTPRLDENGAVKPALHFSQRVLAAQHIRPVQLIPTETQVFYRPVWVAYYGDESRLLGSKYLPFPGDGLSFMR